MSAEMHTAAYGRSAAGADRIRSGDIPERWPSRAYPCSAVRAGPVVRLRSAAIALVLVLGVALLTGGAAPATTASGQRFLVETSSPRIELLDGKGRLLRTIVRHVPTTAPDGVSGISTPLIDSTPEQGMAFIDRVQRLLGVRFGPRNARP